MSYSEHFRRKILAKLEEGYSIRAVAAQFEINKNTIVEWKKRIEIKKLVYKSAYPALPWLFSKFKARCKEVLQSRYRNSHQCLEALRPLLS